MLRHSWHDLVITLVTPKICPARIRARNLGKTLLKSAFETEGDRRQLQNMSRSYM